MRSERPTPRKKPRPSTRRRSDAQPTDESGATHKLQKILAQSGLGSRRDMEELIKSGKVTVNGKPAELGARVGGHDRIELDGRPLRTHATPRAPRVLVYHKPEGEITSRDDPRGRPSVFERLPAMSGSKWISIGRLDFNTCGLLLFTTSGELANRMMHPRFEIEREYAVRVMGQLRPEHLRQLTQGVELEDGPARCESVELRSGEGTNQWCHVVLKEGRHRVVRRMFEKLGFMVSRLMRVRYGNVDLPPRLKRGQYQELSADETKRLLAWLDRSLPASASAPSSRAPTQPKGRRARA